LKIKNVVFWSLYSAINLLLLHALTTIAALGYLSVIPALFNRQSAFSLQTASLGVVLPLSLFAIINIPVLRIQTKKIKLIDTHGKRQFYSHVYNVIFWILMFLIGISSMRLFSNFYVENLPILFGGLREQIAEGQWVKFTLAKSMFVVFDALSTLILGIFSAWLLLIGFRKKEGFLNLSVVFFCRVYILRLAQRFLLCPISCGDNS